MDDEQSKEKAIKRMAQNPLAKRETIDKINNELSKLGYQPMSDQEAMMYAVKTRIDEANKKLADAGLPPLAPNEVAVIGRVLLQDMFPDLEPVEELKEEQVAMSPRPDFEVSPRENYGLESIEEKIEEEAASPLIPAEEKPVPDDPSIVPIIEDEGTSYVVEHLPAQTQTPSLAQIAKADNAPEEIKEEFREKQAEIVTGKDPIIVEPKPSSMVNMEDAFAKAKLAVLQQYPKQDGKMDIEISSKDPIVEEVKSISLARTNTDLMKEARKDVYKGEAFLKEHNVNGEIVPNFVHMPTIQGAKSISENKFFKVIYDTEINNPKSDWAGLSNYTFLKERLKSALFKAKGLLDDEDDDDDDTNDKDDAIDPEERYIDRKGSLAPSSEIPYKKFKESVADYFNADLKEMGKILDHKVPENEQAFIKLLTEKQLLSDDPKDPMKEDLRSLYRKFAKFNTFKTFISEKNLDQFDTEDLKGSEYAKTLRWFPEQIIGALQKIYKSNIDEARLTDSLENLKESGFIDRRDIVSLISAGTFELAEMGSFIYDDIVNSLYASNSDRLKNLQDQDIVSFKENLPQILGSIYERGVIDYAEGLRNYLVERMKEENMFFERKINDLPEGNRFKNELDNLEKSMVRDIQKVASVKMSDIIDDSSGLFSVEGIKEMGSSRLNNFFLSADNRRDFVMQKIRDRYQLAKEKLYNDFAKEQSIPTFSKDRRINIAAMRISLLDEKDKEDGGNRVELFRSIFENTLKRFENPNEYMDWLANIGQDEFVNHFATEAIKEQAEDDANEQIEEITENFINDAVVEKGDKDVTVDADEQVKSSINEMSFEAKDELKKMINSSQSEMQVKAYNSILKIVEDLAKKGIDFNKPKDPLKGDHSTYGIISSYIPESLIKNKLDRIVDKYQSQLNIDKGQKKYKDRLKSQDSETIQRINEKILPDIETIMDIITNASKKGDKDGVMISKSILMQQPAESDVKKDMSAVPPKKTIIVRKIGEDGSKTVADVKINKVDRKSDLDWLGNIPDAGSLSQEQIKISKQDAKKLIDHYREMGNILKGRLSEDEEYKNPLLKELDLFSGKGYASYKKLVGEIGRKILRPRQIINGIAKQIDSQKLSKEEIFKPIESTNDPRVRNLFLDIDDKNKLFWYNFLSSKNLENVPKFLGNWEKKLEKYWGSRGYGTKVNKSSLSKPPQLDIPNTPLPRFGEDGTFAKYEPVPKGFKVIDTETKGLGIALDISKLKHVEKKAKNNLGFFAVGNYIGGMTNIQENVEDARNRSYAVTSNDFIIDNAFASNKKFKFNKERKAAMDRALGIDSSFLSSKFQLDVLKDVGEKPRTHWSGIFNDYNIVKVNPETNMFDTYRKDLDKDEMIFKRRKLFDESAVPQSAKIVEMEDRQVQLENKKSKFSKKLFDKKSQLESRLKEDLSNLEFGMGDPVEQSKKYKEDLSEIQNEQEKIDKLERNIEKTHAKFAHSGMKGSVVEKSPDGFFSLRGSILLDNEVKNKGSDEISLTYGPNYWKFLIEDENDLSSIDFDKIRLLDSPANIMKLLDFLAVKHYQGGPGSEWGSRELSKLPPYVKNLYRSYMNANERKPHWKESLLDSLQPVYDITEGGSATGKSTRIKGAKRKPSGDVFTNTKFRENHPWWFESNISNWYKP